MKTQLPVCSSNFKHLNITTETLLAMIVIVNLFDFYRFVISNIWVFEHARINVCLFLSGVMPV